MDIGQEINRHLAWIETVGSMLSHEKISEEQRLAVTRHDRCALGQWLNSAHADRFTELPELAQLKESHEAFHRMAGALIAALEAGDEAEAIDLQGRFIALSQRVIDYLYVLQRAGG